MSWDDAFQLQVLWSRCRHQ